MDNGMQICIICFKNSTESPLLQLWDTGEDKIVFAEKLQSFITEQKLIHTEYTLLCTECAKDLNDAYSFKAKVVSSQNFWNSTCIQSSIQPVNFIPPESNVVKTFDPCNIEGKHEIIQNNTVINNIKHYETYTVISSINGTLDIKGSDGGHNTSKNVQDYDVEDCLLDVSERDIKINDIIDELDNSEDLDNPDNPENDFGGSDCLESLEFTCLQCLIKFYSKSELVQHACSVTSVQPSVNPEIPKKVPSKNKCKRRRLTSKQKRMVTCTICGYVTDKQWKLHKHSANVHHEKTFTCDFCPKAFKQSYHLREHMTIHTGERKYSCNFCDKKFQRISSQKRHMRTHDAPPGAKVKKRPYLCPICGKNFPYNNGAQRHMRTHTGEKRFQCKICAKQFVQSTHLQVHLRTHTGEKPYMCNVCGDCFSLKVMLQKHLNVHKGDVKIYQNLEPNLNETFHCDRKVNHVLINDLGKYI